jgi:hypothetical protein
MARPIKAAEPKTMLMKAMLDIVAHDPLIQENPV